MFNKEYPKAVTLRKGLLIAGCILMGIIMLIIVMNLQQLSHKKKHQPQDEQVKTVATPSDKLWFTNATQKPLVAVSSNTADTQTPIAQKTAQKTSLKAAVVAPTLTAEETRFQRELEMQRRETAKAMSASIDSNMLTPQSVKTSASSRASGQSNNNNIPDNDQNRQGEKKAFLREGGSVKTGMAQLANPITPYELKAGTVIPGIMISGINSDLPGFIKGQVRQSVYDTTSGRHLLLPQGSQLFGQYDSQVVYGQERVLVVWNQITFPNGQTLDLSGMPGTDMSGYAGFTDRVNNHYFRLFSSVLLMSVMTTAAQQSQPADNSDDNNPDVSQTLAASVGTNMASTMNAMARKNLNIQPTLEIRPGYLFNIMVTKNMVFESAYQGETVAQ